MFPAVPSPDHQPTNPEALGTQSAATLGAYNARSMTNPMQQKKSLNRCLLAAEFVGKIILFEFLITTVQDSKHNMHWVNTGQKNSPKSDLSCSMDYITWAVTVIRDEYLRLSAVNPYKHRSSTCQPTKAGSPTTACPPTATTTSSSACAMPRAAIIPSGAPTPARDRPGRTGRPARL